MNETFVERFDRYYDLLKMDPMRGLRKDRMKDLLRLMNVYEDRHRLTAVSQEVGLRQSVDRKSARQVIDLYIEQVRSKPTNTDGRIMAIHAASVLGPNTLRVRYTLNDGRQNIMLDWREYQIYQLIMEEQSDRAHELSVISVT